MIDQNVSQRIIELNVGGEKYQTTLATLTKDSNSVLSRQLLALESPRDSSPPPADDTERDSVISCFSSGSYFIDRDGKLFRYVLEYLRNGKLILPESFNEYEALYEEARFFNVDGLLQEIQERIAYRAKSARDISTIDRSGEFTLCDTLDGRSDGPGHITIGYRGSFTFGRNGQAEVNFRKLNRILVCGRASTCREVFRDTLNESRDPDRGGGNRYTSRMFLKHASLEQAFDMLAEKGFRLIASCASAASYGYSDTARSGTENEEAKWNHYNEFVFFREVIYSLANRDCETNKAEMENCMISDTRDTGRVLPSLMDRSDIPDIIELHVGNCTYVTTWATVQKQGMDTAELFRQKITASKSDDKMLKKQSAFPNPTAILEFFDRDGELFRYILEYMRNSCLVLPKNFRDYKALKKEAMFYKLKQLADLVQHDEEKNWRSLNWLISSPERDSIHDHSENYITLGHMAGFTLARPGQPDAVFRKVNRITVCGKVSNCREIFGNNLNESRDPNCEVANHYTYRMFLKHNILELAFDQLALNGYRVISICSSVPWPFLPEHYVEEYDWSHYMEYVFGKA
ncbi:BTB [Trichuris trichiura]|uniref:BTB n=1 Tax=Trichuris trichiura TaxID=36087 RepID=A0A077Z9M1_TRITR|nr:BTB [Trichuris trichiura]